MLVPMPLAEGWLGLDVAVGWRSSLRTLVTMPHLTQGVLLSPLLSASMSSRLFGRIRLLCAQTMTGAARTSIGHEFQDFLHLTPGFFCVFFFYFQIIFEGGDPLIALLVIANRWRIARSIFANSLE